MIAKTKTNIEKTAAYIRASSDQQMAASPARQKADCGAIAKRFDLPAIAEDGFYAEGKARSGLERGNRSALAKLLIDAEDGKFNAVVIAETSRLSREEFLDQADLWKRIRDAGVRLFTSFGEVDFTDTGSVLQMVIHAQNAHQESKTLAFRTTSGKRSKLGIEDPLKKPEYLNALVPGFIKEFSIGGNVVHVSRYSDPPRSYIKPKGAICTLRPTDDLNELDAVRAMFRTLADGKNSREAAEVFNSFGMITPAGNPWIPSLIRQMARKRQYIGECEIGQYQRAKFANVTEAPTIIKGICPAIIDRDTWEAAQYTLDVLAQNPGRQSRDPKYLLSGLLFSEAGLPMYGRPHNGGRSYVEWLNPRKPQGEAHRTLSLRCDPIDNAVLRILRGFFGEPEAVRAIEEKLVEELRTVEAVADPTAAELQSIRESIEKTAKRVLTVEDDGAVGIINQEIRRLRQRENELKTRQDRTRERGQRTATVRKALAELPALLNTPSPELGNVLAGCIDRIVISRAGGGWSAEVRFYDGAVIILEDRDIYPEMVCHKLADFIEEQGEATTEEISRATGVRSRSVSGMIKRAISRGRGIERKALGVYTYAASVTRGQTASTFDSLVTLARLVIGRLENAA